MSIINDLLNNTGFVFLLILVAGICLNWESIKPHYIKVTACWREYDDKKKNKKE